MKYAQYFISFDIKHDKNEKNRVMRILSRIKYNEEEMGITVREDNFRETEIYNIRLRFYDNSFLIKNINKLLECCKEIVKSGSCYFAGCRLDIFVKDGMVNYFIQYSSYPHPDKMNLDAKAAYKKFKAYHKELVNGVPFLIIKQKLKNFKAPGLTLKSNKFYKLTIKTANDEFDKPCGITVFSNGKDIYTRVIATGMRSATGIVMTLYGLIFSMRTDDIDKIFKKIKEKLKERGCTLKRFEEQDS